MAESNLTNFSLACSGFIRTTILTPIVQYLTAKGMDVNVDELVTHLQLPAPRMSPLISSINPGGQFNTSSTPAIAPSTSGSRGKVVASSVIEPGKCEYRFQRGEHKNKYCCKPVEPGSIYCRTCLKTRKCLDGSRGGARNSPSLTLNDEPFVNAPQEHMSLDVKPYDLSKNLYIETLHNILIHASGENQDNLVAIGCVIDGTLTKVTPLARKYLETFKIPIAEQNDEVQEQHQEVPVTRPVNMPLQPQQAIAPSCAVPQVVPQMVPVGVPSMARRVPAMPVINR